MQIFLALLLSLTARAAPLRPAEDVLTEKLAESRREQIRGVHYRLALTFAAGSDEYSGQEEIDVELAATSRPLSLDWKGRKPVSLTVNDVPVADYSVREGSLTIPQIRLAKNMVIRIDFTNAFGKEGDGIQRVVDPADKQEYVYTDFEPYGAHQLFPCFDQPDLKAHFDLTVTVPQAWTAIGNELVEHVVASGDTVTTKFRSTPLLSTYLFFVGAGPFEVWKDQYGKTPLEIYARKSLAKYVDAANLFATMKKGLHFYRDYFNFEYPFAKFGLVFAPEFGWGGMENPGAVVVNERELFRGPVPATRRESRDSLVLHEMAHHWFGDLVTMKWWNDLWLNESFATYLSSIALERAFQSKTVWEEFASGKSWGTWQDQLVTTHPIEAKVPDTRAARGNFDGITYAKGAAALQQLHFYVGEDAFRNGVEAYFRTHAFGNAERSDFMDAIANAGRLNLDTWTRDWLETAGVNRVSASWICAQRAGGETLDSLSVLQEASSSGTLSPHRTRLGFYRKENGALKLVRAEDAAYTAASNPIRLAPTACPDFVFPNLDDRDYALFSLDKASMSHVALVLSGGVDYPLLRLQTWMILGQMVRDAKLAPLDYFRFALGGLKKEDDEGTLSFLLGRRSPVLAVYRQYLSPADRRSLAPDLEGAVLARLGESAKGSDRQMMFFDFYVRAAQSPPALAKIAGWLTKNDPPAGIQLDSERRWAAVLALARNGYAGAGALIDAEEKRDSSDLGKRMAFAARVALPSLAAKAAFWIALERPKTIPPSTLREAAGEFHQPNFPDLSQRYVRRYFDRLRGIDWKKNDYLVGVYFHGLFPGEVCSKRLLQESEARLKSQKGLTALARRSWLEANDELRRCVKVRHLVSNSFGSVAASFPHRFGTLFWP